MLSALIHHKNAPPTRFVHCKFRHSGLHLGFDLNHGVPRKLFLTEGNGAERPFVSNIIDPGQTGVLDRGYQAHHLFDQWQQDKCHFVCRIKEATHHDILEELPVPEDSHVFFDAKVFLGTPNVNSGCPAANLCNRRNHLLFLCNNNNIFSKDRGRLSTI
ncbi:MAG: transposase [Deltaproteobacteria bacterium]|nr:transposase [Deltaproteobacteria bacterium]